jgi:hypothetical protein
MFVNRMPFPPIFFFGNPQSAVAATFGVNPSAQEFSSSRKLTKLDDAGKLVARCKSYFETPFGVPAHPWFEPWRALVPKLLTFIFKLGPRIK